MKPRKPRDLKELNDSELLMALKESQETYSKQRFQHALRQLQDTSYLKILKKDIARIQTIIKERNVALNS
jgi:large subunit ribosomal protein L29